MRIRCAALAVMGLLAVTPVVASAQTIPTDAIAIVTNPVTLEREVPAGTLPFQAYVVFLNPTYGFGAVGAAQFRIELDPGLELIAATTEALVIQPADLEYVIAYPNCSSEWSGDPFVLLTLVIGRDASTQAGAAVTLGRLESLDEGIRATRCAKQETFSPINFGGIVVDGNQPTVVGFVATPAQPVQGSSYDVAWETAGGGSWLLDGAPVAPRGLTRFSATGLETRELASTDGSASASVTVETIREPVIHNVDFELTGVPGEVRVSWTIVGATGVHITGIGYVATQGSRLVSVDEHPVLEFAATNTWGTSWHSLELVAPTDPPTVEMFELDPSDYAAGQAVLLRYAVAGATSVTIDPEFGRVPIGQGGMQITPVEGGVWRLTATNSLGSASAEVTTHTPPPHISRFYADPDAFGPGLPVDLHYIVVGADSVWMEPLGILEQHAGFVTVTSLVEPTIYKLVARNATDTVSSELTLESRAPTLNIGLDPTFAGDEPVFIVWHVQWADSVRMYPDGILVGSEDGSWRRQVYPDSATTYRFVATNAIGTTAREATIVPGPPRIAQFRVDPTPAMIDDIGNIEWEVYGADRIEIRDVSGPVPGLVQPDSIPPVEGSIPYTFDHEFSGLFYLEAWNQYGSTLANNGRLMQVEPYRNMIHTFYTDHPVVGRDGSALLRWEVENWGTYYLDPGDRWLGSGLRGHRFVYPEPGTNAYILRGVYRFHAQTDTAWVMVEPRSSFEVATPRFYPGDDLDFNYSAPGADRVVILPEPGEVDPTGNLATTRFDTVTVYEFNAWYDGEREVIQRRIRMSRPFISYFEAQDNWLPDDKPVHFRWDAVGAESLELVTPSGTRISVLGQTEYIVDPPVFGRWILDANNESSFWWREIRLKSAAELIDDVHADPLTIVRGDSTTIYWDIDGATEVRIYYDRRRGLPGSGSLAVVPEASRNYAIHAYGAAVEGYFPRLAPVRVDLDAQHPPTLYLSSSPDVLAHNPEPLHAVASDGFPRFDIYVMARDLLGSVRAVDLFLEIPQWLAVDEFQPVDGESRTGSGNRIVLNPELCDPTWRPLFMNPDQPFSGVLGRVRLKQVGNAPHGVATTVSIAPAPTWHLCIEDVPFGTPLPGVPLEVEGVLEMRNIPLPVRLLPLSLRWVDAGLELSWPGLPVGGFTSLQLLRGSSAARLEPLAEVVDAASWIDSSAPLIAESGPCYYQLVGRTPDDALWQSQVIAVEDASAPARPARTRFVGVRPNPFNPRTTIHWELANASAVLVTIYDLAGRRVREWRLPEQPWGPGNLDWDGTDHRGAHAASGVYLVRLQADGFADTKRVTLLK